MNIASDRVNYIEWLDVSYQQDSFLQLEEIEQRIILATCGLIYKEDEEYVSSALTYVENGFANSVIHIPQNMILSRREILLKKINFKKIKMSQDELLLVKIKYLDASKDYNILNGADGSPGIFCWTAGIAVLFDNGVISVCQDFCPKTRTFREVYHIPEQCIVEVMGAKVKFKNKK